MDLFKKYKHAGYKGYIIYLLYMMILPLAALFFFISSFFNPHPEIDFTEINQIGNIPIERMLKS
ncbi:MAG: hypothetical protein ACOVP1_00520 [Bacteroidia bacterium]